MAHPDVLLAPSAGPAGAVRVRRGADGSTVVVRRGRWRTEPALVEAALPGARFRRLAIGPGRRRRAVFTVELPSGTEAVVKVASGEQHRRGELEQAVLADLGAAGVTGVPRPLGAGVLGAFAWSAETAVTGVTIRSASRWWRRRHGWPALDALADWIDLLATRTAQVGPAMVHGDLASGWNVLVRRREVTVVDWETAGPGRPLVDLLPTLALLAARVERRGDAAGQAAYALQLCRGDLPRSQWLFDRVRRHVQLTGARTDAAGELAVAAWRHQARLRERHDELVRAAGETPVAWTSPGELVLAGWEADPLLGRRWEALPR